MLDATGQRIVGTLLEKELAVPESYPLTTAALIAGCNQKSNRDPEMSLEDWQVEGALEQLRAEGWVVRVDGGRAVRFRHAVDDRLGLDARQKAVLTELLVRGPQAPGALERRVARLGFAPHDTDEVRTVLDALRDRAGGPLVVRLERQPRERDARWSHTLGAAGDAGAGDAGVGGAGVGERAAGDERPSTAAGGGGSGARDAAAPTSPSPRSGARPEASSRDAGPPGGSPPTASTAELAARVADLETRVAALERRLAGRDDRAADA